MNPRDISQMYSGVLCLYKGSPVKVLRVREDCRVEIFRLIHQNTSIVNFSFEDFSAPKGRIGFVNEDGNAFYVKRLPYRKFYNGVCSDNCSFTCPNAKVPGYSLRNFTSQSFVNTLFNDYPSFEEALKMLKEGWNSVAFDKQFCVTKLGNIYYKTNKVGVVKDDKIHFQRKYEYLRSLIGVTYEKTF